MHRSVLGRHLGGPMRRYGRATRAAIAVAMAASTAGVIVGTALLFPANADSFSVNVAPTDDSYILQSQPGANFGTQSMMKTNGARKKIERAYLKFTVTQIPPGATFVGATLTLTALNSPNIKPALRRVTNNAWSEQTLTYSNAPAVGKAIASDKTVN